MVLKGYRDHSTVIQLNGNNLDLEQMEPVIKYNMSGLYFHCHDLAVLSLAATVKFETIDCSALVMSEAAI